MVLFVLLGAIMVLAMHAGFAFLEVGTVRFKNQVNALVKILSDFAASQEAAMEDLFDVVFYTNLVNAAYRGYLSQPISPPNLNSPSVRLRDRVTDYLNDHPLQGGLSFNHRRPARLFAENSGRLANEISPQTRERFRNLFTWLSDLESATVARSSSLP